MLGPGQVGARHARKQVVFNLEVEASESHIGEPTAGHVPRGDDLAAEEAQFLGGIDDRHSLVVGSEAAPEVDGEDGLLNADECQSLERGEHPEDAGEIEGGMQTEERCLQKGGPVALTYQALHAQHVNACTPQHHQREEQWCLPFLHEARRGSGRRCVRPPVIWRRGDGNRVDVGIATDLVRVRVMGAVLWHPPPEAHADQDIADGQPEKAVGSP